MNFILTLSTGLHSYFIQSKNDITDSAKERNFFCKCLKTSASALKQCDECTVENYTMALESKKVQTYSCHAGLVKWSVPVRINEVTGVIISEGVISKRQVEESEDWINYLAEKYNVSKTILMKNYSNVREMTEEQVDQAIALFGKALLRYYKTEVKIKEILMVIDLMIMIIIFLSFFQLNCIEKTGGIKE